MKGVLDCLFLKLIVLKIEDNVCLLFLKLKLDAKEGTANGRTHLHIFIKFIKKNKKNSEITAEKKWAKQKKKINRKLR